MAMTLRERIAALQRELESMEFRSDQQASATDGRVLDGGNLVPAKPSNAVGRPAWECATELASLRDRRRGLGQDCSVRALAREAGCSRGRVGELLKMHDELSSRVALFLGWGDVSEGQRLLSQLSYRDLRAVIGIPAVNVMWRVSEIRRLLGKPDE